MNPYSYLAAARPGRLAVGVGAFPRQTISTVSGSKPGTLGTERPSLSEWRARGW